jgi:hypothetical protein
MHERGTSWACFQLRTSFCNILRNGCIVVPKSVRKSKSEAPAIYSISPSSVTVTFGHDELIDMYKRVIRTSKLARANSATRFDKVILIYDSLFILLKSSTLNLHVDISASISKLVSVHPNFVAWVVLD